MKKQSNHIAKSPAALSRRDALKVGAAGLAWIMTLGHISPAIASELSNLTQDQPMTGARLAEILQTERTKWNALLAQIPPARMEEPGVEGTWSAKELVAHLTWYERQVVEGAAQVLLTGKYVRPNHALGSMDERNASIAAESRARPLTDVLTEADQQFSQLLSVVASCPDGILNDPHFLGLPDDIVPWMAIANNSYAHYREHEPALREWIATA